MSTAKKTAEKKPVAGKSVGHKPGLYENIHAKQERIASGSGESMRKPGEEGRPDSRNFSKAAKTEKKPVSKRVVSK